MTTTITPPVQPPPVQPPPEHKSWLSQFPRDISRGIVAAIVVALLLAAGIAATLMLTVFSTQSAASILSGNGYQVTQQLSGNQIPASVQPYISSAAEGTYGSSHEAVVVFKDSATAMEGLVANAARADGYTAIVNGDVVTIIGSQPFSGLGN